MSVCVHKNSTHHERIEAILPAWNLGFTTVLEELAVVCIIDKEALLIELTFCLISCFFSIILKLQSSEQLTCMCFGCVR